MSQKLMDDLKSLGRDVTAFSKELEQFEQYLNNDNEPLNTDETIQKFRSVSSLN